MSDSIENGEPTAVSVGANPYNTYGLATQGFVWAAISSVSGNFDGRVKTVNRLLPDDTGNVNVTSIRAEDYSGEVNEIHADLTVLSGDVEYRLLTNVDYNNLKNYTDERIDELSGNSEAAFAVLSAASGGWNNAETEIQSSSADWHNVETKVETTSGEWDAVYSSVNSASSYWNNAETEIQSSSADWHNAKTEIQSSSADWHNANSKISSSSADWDSVTTITQGNSANWISVYTSVSEASAKWDNAETEIETISANAHSVYTSVNEASSGWNNAQTKIEESSGNYDSVFTSVNTVSSDWNNATSKIESSSANYDSVYSSVDSASSGWNNAQTKIEESSGNYDSVYSSVNSTSATWDNAASKIESSSGNYDSVYSSVESASSDWDNAQTEIESSSADWHNVETKVESTSGNWDSVYTSVESESAGWQNHVTFKTVPYAENEVLSYYTSSIQSPSVGDALILKKQLVEGDTTKYAYSSFSYDGVAWKPSAGIYNVDGGAYSADNVFFTVNLTSTYSIGNIDIGTTGSAVISSKGKNIRQVFNDIFLKEEFPTATKPSIALSYTNMGSYESGTWQSPTYSISYTKGSYTYGPESQSNATGYNLSFYGKNYTSQSGAVASIFMTDAMSANNSSLRMTASASYGTDTVIPVTNIGNPYPSVKIMSSITVPKYSTYIKSYRQSFCGGMDSKSIPVDSNVIRSLVVKSGKYLMKGSSISMDYNVGDIRAVFAYPSAVGDATSITDKNAFDANIIEAFTKSVVQVNDASGANPINYNVYVKDAANPNDTANKYTMTI